jgi:hypothetical protein
VITRSVISATRSGVRSSVIRGKAEVHSNSPL